MPDDGGQPTGHWALRRPFLPALRRVFASGRKAAFPATGDSLCLRDPAATCLLQRIGVEHSGAGGDTTARSRERGSLTPTGHLLAPVLSPLPRQICRIVVQPWQGPTTVKDLHERSLHAVVTETVRAPLTSCPALCCIPLTGRPASRGRDMPAIQDGHTPSSPQDPPCQRTCSPFRQKILGRYHRSDFWQM